MYLQIFHKITLWGLCTPFLLEPRRRIPLPFMFRTAGDEPYLSWASSCLQGLETGARSKSEWREFRTKACKAWWGGAGLGLSPPHQGPPWIDSGYAVIYRIRGTGWSLPLAVPLINLDDINSLVPGLPDSTRAPLCPLPSIQGLHEPDSLLLPSLKGCPLPSPSVSQQVVWNIIDGT